MAPAAGHSLPPTAAEHPDEPVVLVQARSEELGLDFAMSVPAKGHRVDSFSNLLADLAMAIGNGSALDVNKKADASQFAAIVQRRAHLRKEEHDFYALLRQRYEQMAVTIQQLKRDYYREIDQLRDQLHAKRRDRNFQVEDISFFDPQAYKIPSWEEVAEHLDGMRMRRELEAQHGGRAVKHVPVHMLCQGCRGKFASRDGEDSEPEDAATQTELAGGDLCVRRPSASRCAQTDGMSAHYLRSLLAQAAAAAPPDGRQQGAAAPGGTSSVAVQAAPGEAALRGGGLGGEAHEQGIRDGLALAASKAHDQRVDDGLALAASKDPPTSWQRSGRDSASDWSERSSAHSGCELSGLCRRCRSELGESGCASVGSSSGRRSSSRPGSGIQFTGNCRRCQSKLRDAGGDSVGSTSGGRTPAAPSEAGSSTRPPSSAGEAGAASRPGSRGELEGAQKGAMKVARALKKLTQRVADEPKASSSIRLAFRRLKWHAEGHGLSAAQRKKLAAKMLERRMAALQAHLQRSALARMQSHWDEWRKPEMPPLGSAVVSMSPSPLRRRNTVTATSVEPQLRRRRSSRTPGPWEGSPGSGPVWQTVCSPFSPAAQREGSAVRARWRALVATPASMRVDSAPSTSPETGGSAPRSSAQQLNFSEWAASRPRTWEADAEVGLPKILAEQKPHSLPSMIGKQTFPSLLVTRPHRFAASS